MFHSEGVHSNYGTITLVAKTYPYITKTLIVMDKRCIIGKQLLNFEFGTSIWFTKCIQNLGPIIPGGMKFENLVDTSVY